MGGSVKASSLGQSPDESPLPTAEDHILHLALRCSDRNDHPRPMAAPLPFLEAPWASPPTVDLHEVGAMHGEVTVLNDVTARMPHAACTAIIGPNGAGKTTLLRCLLGLLPHTGTITRRFTRLGYVPQRLALDRSLPLTAEEALTIAISDRPLFLGISAAHKARAKALLAEVCADHLAQRPLGTLSGGELQRVMLAQALGREPDLLVLDEPGTGLDTHGHRLCCDLTADARRRRGITQVMVSHDLDIVAAHADHVILLDRTVIRQGPPSVVLVPEVLDQAFGRHGAHA